MLTPKRSSKRRQVSRVSANSTPVSIVTIRKPWAAPSPSPQQLVDQHRLLLLKGAQQHGALAVAPDSLAERLREAGRRVRPRGCGGYVALW